MQQYFVQFETNVAGRLKQATVVHMRLDGTDMKAFQRTGCIVTVKLVGIGSCSSLPRPQYSYIIRRTENNAMLGASAVEKGWSRTYTVIPISLISSLASTPSQ